VTTKEAKSSSWIALASAKLSSRRLRAQAAVLALVLWGAVAVDYSLPGLFDRAGNIKFQDFLQFPIAARLIATGNADQLYDDEVLARGIRAISGRDTRVYLQYFYGPQVALPFIPLGALPFLIQAGIWVALSLLIYFGCVYLIWKRCAALRSYRALVALCALAYPPLFHFFVRGQLSAIVLVCFTGAYLAFAAQRDFLAGVALGVLAFKPQFLVAIPLILLFAQAWKVLSGIMISAAAQLTLTWLYFGRAIMLAYFTRLLHSASHPGSTELIFSPIQMHSLHSFWEILIPWRPGVWVLYLLSSFAVIGIAAAIWKSSVPVAFRFSALMFAAVLVNPHIYIYDLLMLAPTFLLLTDWSLHNSSHPAKPPLDVLLYIAFLLPLFGPLARWTHLQFSVVIFVAILWILHRIATTSHKLAFAETGVV
jgi:alpha-1,2-mannosyltransferase